MKALTPEEMRRMDAKTIQMGTPSLELMERAAGQVAAVAREMCPQGAVAVLCGKGNNGGDGIAAARLLADAGHDVAVGVLAPSAMALKGDAAINMQRLLAQGKAQIAFIQTVAQLDAFMQAQRGADLLIDALLGTGMSRAPEGLVREAIVAINGHSAPVLSVDIASGVDGASGMLPGETVHARVTVSLHMPKVGQILYPGRWYQGQLRIGDIGIDPGLANDCGVDVLTQDEVRALLPARPAHGYKNTFGHVLVLAGSRGMAGAGELCGRATLRAGAGMTTFGAPASLLDIYMQKFTEIMVCALPDDGKGCLSSQVLPYLPALLEGKAAVAVGPGWGKGADLPKVLQAVLAQVQAPLVLDADGINALAKLPDYRRSLPKDVVLTPHPGELARIYSAPSKEIAQDPMYHARMAASRLGAVVALKGACTVIAAPDGALTLNPTGNAGMGTAGSGDVLTGIIAGLLAQGAAPYDAARLGVYIHGAAGDAYARACGMTGLIASDLIETLPQVWHALGR
nr:NAD(P)H-hydrate dehydratase [Maliibacterium massiliense]